MQIKYTPRANENLIDMGDHYREVGGNKLARRMVASIKSEIGLLREFPERAMAYELAPGIRRLVIAGGAFLAFYRVHNNIEVLPIRRAEREPVTAELLK
ncbi:MAG: type II toxin-antitoxin system RelE/ParE family toxin [Gallionella sp.]|nr:type II toxin-antitoxin system RelE/ParE family toxin [Gallionella sp.]